MVTKGLWKGALAATLFSFGLAGAAQANTMTGTFGVSIYQFNCSGCDINSSGEAATLANVIAHSGNLVDTGSYTGALNFIESGPQSNDGNIGVFLSSAPGAHSNTLSPATLALSLSSDSFNLTTIMVFTGTSGPSVGSITHDDGIGLYNSSDTLLTGNDATIPTATPSPTSPVGYNFTGGNWTLVYVEANGLPAVLDFEVISGSSSTTPIPAALPLFASGLGVLGLFGRRRKRKSAAAYAAA